MAESNPVQVTLSDDGIKIINAQNTANNAASGVANLNDPNLMSVIEKQTQVSQFAGLTSQYNVILNRSKEDNISTNDLTTAYTNLNTFMSSILTDTTKASDVDRDTYKSLTDAYNTALSNVQNALNDSFNTDIDNMQSSVAVASQAASSAGIIASQAAITGDNASQVASQAASAANQASADYTALSAGVKDGSVIHITTKTAIDSAVIGTAEIADAAITDAKIGNISANHLTAGSIDFNTIAGKNINASNITTGTMSTDRLNVGKLSALSANLGDVTAGSLKGVNIVANTFSTPNGSFTTDSNGAVVASNLTIKGVTNLVYNAALLGGSGSSIPGWTIGGNGYYSNATLHDGVPSVGWNNSTGSGAWDCFAQTKLYPLNGLTGQSYSASVWFIEYGSDTSLNYSFVLAFFDSNRNRISDKFIIRTWNGIGSAQPWRYITINNAVSPSNAVYVGLQFWSHNGTGHALFSSPMLTQTAQSTGYQPDTGNIINAGQVILGNDGTLTTTYTGITQDSDSYYNAWTLKNGTLSIGQGYITSTATGNRVVSNVAQTASTVQGTITAAYLKFTEPDIPARTYLDATHFTVSSDKQSDIVTIDRTGVSLKNDAALYGPVLDWSGDGVQSQNLIMGLSPHTINTTTKHEIAFEIGRGDTGDYANIHVWSVVTASQLSKKKEVSPYSDNGTVVANTSLATYRYNQDDNTDIMHVGPIIDDTNANKEWFIRPEIVSTSGELGGAEIDLPASIFYGWSAIKALQRENESLQIRLRKLEIEEGA
ncbi:phage tail protein [Lactiplantibacillus mudanjiangensis]|uniref:Phage tail protein [Lactobacillus plantarum] n=1 Tax=Lactiplantibacillus mudanjiangensis TaxID=1296538 RepID=A0A660E782_9LACO|nr:phage tail protein [Lactiplantibacillus mudanjiangensis]VDG25757.1 phage tail protein [Lactobacillus plantarum] [Lactiplantibacillus mudanjiangensis]VDG28917.1 phage tail protein [Lactobacillus plantarum] [Lactiplantibacillus mudanjiangensis]